MTDHIPNLIESLGITLTQDDVARRAYQLYEQRGGEHGHDWDEWFQAEREVRQCALHGVRNKSVMTEGPYAAT